jgi:hypothetical protein
MEIESKEDFIMKKFTALVVSLLLAGALFAQSNKKLIVGVYDFATESSDSWTVYEPSFKSIDPINEKYVFTACFVIKNIVGLTRYDFTCNIAKVNEDFSVELTDMSSFACDKNLKIVKNGSVYKTSAKVAREYAKQIKDEINKRMNSWSDADYEIKLNSTVTSPLVLGCVANNSALVFKKFVKDYEIIGRTIKTSIYVTKIDEAPNYAEGYSYYVAGNALCGYRIGEFNISYPEYASIMVYTNNDAVISLTPAETMDGLLDGTSGSKYEINGTIKDIKQKSTGGLSIIEVNE